MRKLKTILQSNFFYYILVFISLFYCFMYNINIKKTSVLDINQNKFNLVVTNKKIDGNKISLELKGKEKLVGSYYAKTESELDYLKNNIKFGSTISLEGSLEKPKENTIPNLFNYKKYLYNKNIYYFIDIKEINDIKESNNYLYILKNKIMKRIESLEYKEYFYALLLGETYYVDEGIYSTYNKNGITHLFALSGMHVIFFASIIMFLLKKIKLSKLIKSIIVFIFLLFLSFLAGFSPSIIRAIFFFLLVEFNNIFNLKIKSLNILLLIFSIYIFIDPYIIFDLSFLLSFIVTFFIIIYMNLFKTKNKIKSTFYISLISFLASLPIIINNFYYVNLFSVINNLFFVPYVTFIIYPLTLITFIFPSIIDLYGISLLIMEEVSIFASNKALIYSSIKFSIILLIVYYVFLFFFSKTNKIKYLFVISFVLIINFYIPRLNDNTQIHFIDVGQGDSTLIITPYMKKTILIDTGGKLEFLNEGWRKKNNNYRVGDNLINYFYSLGIRKIDYLFITHGDYDHAGDAKYLIDNFSVKKVFINNGEINELESKIKEKEKLDGDLKIDNVYIKNLNNRLYDDENDNSLVLNITINNKDFLFMGDASTKVEEDLKLNKVYLLKVGHHGSDNSTSKSFVDKIRPKYSIISVGESNRYGHPKKEVLKNLKDTKILRTDKNGTIIFRLKDNNVKIKTMS